MDKSEIDRISEGVSKRDVVNLYDLMTHSYLFSIVGSDQLKVVGLDNEHLVDDHIRGIVSRFKREFIALTQQRMTKKQ
jgi:hypothetical protein